MIENHSKYIRKAFDKNSEIRNPTFEFKSFKLTTSNETKHKKISET